MISNRNITAAGWYTVSNFISKCMIYIFTPYYTRLLSEADYGQLNNFSSWRSVLLVLLTFDLYSTIPVAYIDYNKEDFNEYVSTISIFSIFFPFLICVSLNILKVQVSTITSINIIYLPVLFLSIVLSAPLLIFQAVQRSQVKYKASSILTLISSLSVVLLTLLLVKILENKLYGVILGSLVGSIIINILVLVILLRKKICFQIRYLKYSLQIALPLIPHVIAGTLLGTSDKIMITKICGNEANAFYSLVYTCSMVVTLLVTSVNNAWVPWFYSQLKENNIKIIQNIVKITVPIMGLCSLMFSLVAPEIIKIIGGKAYEVAAPLMPPIILSCFVHYLYTLYVNIIFYEKKTIWISIGTIISCVTNIILNYIFINSFGYAAAAYTTLFSNILLLLFNYLVCKRMNKASVFNTPFLCACLLIFFSLCMMTLITYNNSIIRIIYIISIITSLTMFLIKNKKTTAFLIHMFK